MFSPKAASSVRTSARLELVCPIGQTLPQQSCEWQGWSLVGWVTCLDTRKVGPYILTTVAETISPELIRNMTPQMLERINWEKHRHELGQLIKHFLPVETLVPDIYADWRPVVRDILGYLVEHLSLGRMVSKLIIQLQLPDDVSLEKRLMILIEGMPSMQKIGQTVARNRNLSSSLRKELSNLENSIDDVSAAAIKEVIESELGELIESHQIEIESEILAEASVSAAIKFGFVRNKNGLRETGVFKVIKPHIRDHLSEELAVLSGMAAHFDKHRCDYCLSEVNLSDLFHNVRRLLAREVNFGAEQTALQQAALRYAETKGVRVPTVFDRLSTPKVTAMSWEPGVKVTVALRSRHQWYWRRQLAARLIESLVAVPLLSQEDQSVFHADPHAGNLFVDETKRELVLLDWALTARLSRPIRRNVLLLLTAVSLRDRRLITRTLSELCEDNLSNDPIKSKALRGLVCSFLENLPQVKLAGVTEALSLVDQMIHTGFSFSTALLVFRKMLFTLDGVLNDVMPGMRMDATLLWLVTQHRAKSSSIYQRLAKETSEAAFPLSRFDQVRVAWSAQFLPFRAVMQAQRRGEHSG